MFQPNQNLYGIGIGSTFGKGANYIHYDVRAPSTMDVGFALGQFWLWPLNGLWVLLSYSSAGGQLTANWVEVVGASGNVIGVNGTANQVTASTTAGTATLSIPSTFIAPGSIASTTTLTGGTGVTATTGNITASGVGSGLVLNPTVVSAGASPQTANGRVGSVTFSGVSIAAGAAQSFTISNTSITGASTILLLSMSGATTGSALTIQSVVNSASQSVITVINGTGATTTVANITFTYEVLN